jgi:formamidopyrimidine-DNA glycosylase
MLMKPPIKFCWTVYFMVFLKYVSFIDGMTTLRSIKRCFTRSSLKMMPEGPEVRSLVDSMSSRFEGSNWKLTSAAIVSGRYEKAPPENWSQMLSKLPADIKQIKCKGKFIYFQCGDFYIFNTLGLSGGWSLSSSKTYTRASFLLTKDTGDQKNLHFYDMIGYGTLKVCLTKEELDQKLKKVGMCWLEEKPSFEDFSTRVKKTKPNRPLVVFLMDQTKLSGIGNYILSEGLYHIQHAPLS